LASLTSKTLPFDFMGSSQWRNAENAAIIPGGRAPARMRRAASHPSSKGIWTSRIASSGSNSAHAATASRPL